MMAHSEKLRKLSWARRSLVQVSRNGVRGDRNTGNGQQASRFLERDFWGRCLITEFIAYTIEEFVDPILVLFRSRIPRCQFVEHSAPGDAAMVVLAILDCFGLNHQPFRQ